MTGLPGSYIILPISCDAEIKNANDRSESGALVEALQETCVQMDRRVRGGKSSIPRRDATVTSRGMCWHFRKAPEPIRETRWHREKILVLVPARQPEQGFFIATNMNHKIIKERKPAANGGKWKNR